MAEICDQLGGFAQCAAALRSLAAERDALRAELDQAVGCIEDANAEREQLQAENARLREALESIEEYWNGAEKSAVDAAEECRSRARAALGEKE
jgi:peptidoglycan hydrolase CwlO-like protein